MAEWVANGRARRFYWSDNGLDWHGASGTRGSVFDVTYIDSSFFAPALGGVLRSATGEDWEMIELTDQVPYNVFGKIGRNFIIAGIPDGATSSELRYSPDLENWTVVDSVVQSELTGLAVGEWASILSSGNPPRIYISTDGQGKQWEKVDDDFPISPEGVAFGNGVFVTVSLRGQIYRSLDGRNWEQTFNNSGLDFKDVFFADTGDDSAHFVVHGIGDTILVSHDGRAWTDQSRDVLRSRFYVKGAYGNGQFIFTSPAGTITN